MTTDEAFPDDRDLLGPDEFRRRHDLDKLLAGAEPLGSVDDLLIEDLTDEEADTLVEAIKA